MAIALDANPGSNRVQARSIHLFLAHMKGVNPRSSSNSNNAWYFHVLKESEIMQHQPANFDHNFGRGFFKRLKEIHGAKT